MRTLLKLLFSGLLLVLTAVVGTEVVALHRAARPTPGGRPAPVVVRKSPAFPAPRKLVRALPLPAPTGRVRPPVASGQSGGR